MFDATRLLGAMLEHRATPSAASRLGTALDRGARGGGPLQQLLSQLGGVSSSASGGGSLGSLLGASAGPGAALGGGGVGGVLGGLAEMARRAAASPRQEVGRNNPVAVGGLGALAGTLLGGGRGAIGGGLLALLGSLAYSALQADPRADKGGEEVARASAQARGLPPGAGSGSAPEVAGAAALTDPEEVQRAATLALKSMIQAAKADGQIDGREIERITGRLDEAGEDPEARAFVLREMAGQADIEGLAREARTLKEAAEVYAASLMAIEVDTQAERDYLARLARELGLSQPTVAYIHESLGVAV
jgi:uncharacterized membrane protein YebE (DUF533 family)